MTQASNIYSNPANKAYASYDDKAYSSNTKALGGLNGPSDINHDGSVDDLEKYAYDLKMWLVQQRDSGVQLSAQDMNTVMGYVNYCSQQLGGWDPFMELGWSPQAGGYGGQAGAYGEQGAVGNATITDGGDFTVDGSVPVTDVWGSETTMNVPPPCTVTFETTTDNRTTPGETVTKAIITNPTQKGPDGKPAQSVVYFHDGVKITCNGSKKGDGTSRVTDNTGSVTVGEYKAGAEAGGTPEASIDGDYDKDTNTYTYDGTGSDAIKFWPQGNGTDGDITTNNVEGNADIYVKNTDRVYVYKNADGKYVTDVVHKDGSTDRYVQGSEYKCNINGVPEHISFGSNEGHSDGTTPEMNKDGTKMGMPADYVENFTVNNEESEKGGKGPIQIGLIDINVLKPSLGDMLSKQYPEQLVALADFIYGQHDKATMDSLMTQLQGVFQADFDEINKGKAAKDKITFAEWIKGPGASKISATNPKFIKFLFQADPTLASLFAEVKGKPIDAVTAQLKDIQTELAGVLNGIFGPGTATAATGNKGGDGLDVMDDYSVYGIKIGDDYYSFYDPDQSTMFMQTAEVGSTPSWDNANDAY